MITDFDKEHKLTGFGYKAMLFAIRVTVLGAVSYFGWPNIKWIYLEMWNIEAYGFISLERIWKLISL